MHNFLQLKVWKVSKELSVEIHVITKEFPKQEIYGITSQIRRAAVSIPSNIAEGSGRNHIKEFVQFLSVANGSSFELYTQIEIAFDVGYISRDIKDKLISKLVEIQKMLYSLIQKFS